MPSGSNVLSYYRSNKKKTWKILKSWLKNIKYIYHGNVKILIYIKSSYYPIKKKQTNKKLGKEHEQIIIKKVETYIL